MPRCPNCNKFVSVEMAEPEMDTLEYTDGTVTGEVRLVQTCADCGAELAEANLDVEIDAEFAHKIETCPGVPEIDATAENNDRYDGGPKTPARYRKHFYVASISGNITCPDCQASCEFSGTAEEMASGFESLV